MSRSPTYLSNYQNKFSNSNKTNIQEQRRAKLSPLNSKSIPSLPAGHWKNHIAPQLLTDENYGKFATNRPYAPIYQESNMEKEQDRLKKKSDIMRRVKQLQEKVLPMIQNDNSQKLREQQQFGWHGRVEQKLLKLQTAIDSIRKEMDIQLERRIMEVEAKWQSKFQDLFNRMQNDI